MLINKIKDQKIGHLPNYQTSLLIAVRFLEDLTGAYGIVFGFISLYVRNKTGFVSPCMIYQKLCIYAEQFIQKVFIVIIVKLTE